MSLQGADALRRRLKAIATVPKGGSSSLARPWQEATSDEARRRVPVRTGDTRRSIRPGATRGGNPTVVGKYTVNFIDAGSKAHDEPRARRRKGRMSKVLKFNAGGRTLFRKKVHKPRIAARPFKKESARKGLERVDFASFVIGLWNRAA